LFRLFVRNARPSTQDYGQFLSECEGGCEMDSAEKRRTMMKKKKCA